MIDPTKITNYDLTHPQLEEVILFWVCAAGKNAQVAAKGLDGFLRDIGGLKHPFKAIRRRHKKYGDVDLILKKNGIGCYSHKARTMIELAYSGLNLETCTTDDLESIYGIGFKTARCFILHSRKNARVAGLDTHILKHLRALGYNAPLSTPSSRKAYLTLEKIVLRLADMVGMSPAEYDLMVWNKYSVRPLTNVKE